MVVAITALTLLSTALLLAQETTPEPTAEVTDMPSSFNDNRINGDVFLGGLALFCEDETGSTAGNTFQNGALTVWGAEGQEYIRLTAAQLRGDEEIPQPPPAMEPGATEEPMMTETVEPEETQEPLASPVLLAQAETANGTIWLFRVGMDTFALQGNDNTGKFFTYTWTSCALGTLTTDQPPFTTFLTIPTVGMTQEATAEATSDAAMPAPTDEATAEATASS
jgi:hypothetical protein